MATDILRKLLLSKFLNEIHVLTINEIDQRMGDGLVLELVYYCLGCSGK